MIDYCRTRLVPYMTRKTANKNHSVYKLKHIVEKEIGRYVSQEELQQTLSVLGYPAAKYYPISEDYFKEES